MGALLTYPKFKAFTNDGNNLPLAGGLLNTYEAGTVNTPQAAYSDILCTVPLSNPVVLDENGEAIIYLKGSYKLVLTDANGDLYWTLDDVTGIGGSSLTSIGAYGGSLETAIAAIGSTPTQLLIDETVVLQANDIVPATLVLQPIMGGEIALNGFNLTIHSSFNPGHFKVLGRRWGRSGISERGDKHNRAFYAKFTDTVYWG